jgi:hypothetical protein
MSSSTRGSNNRRAEVKKWRPTRDPATIYEMNLKMGKLEVFCVLRQKSIV